MLDVKKLMSGIGVVIDDAFGKDDDKGDKIFSIVKKIRKEWETPLYEISKIPTSDYSRESLLHSASFVLLDWQLWPEEAGEEAEKSGIEDNIEFLQKAKEYFVPVFIFTNTSKDDVIGKLEKLYSEDNHDKNFIFIETKEALSEENDFTKKISDWMKKNPSVYVLKTWEQVFYEAKRDLFSSMYDKSLDWPKVFWESYKGDNIDPNLSMINLINASLLGRIKVTNDEFDDELLIGCSQKVSKEELQSVIEGISFIQEDNLFKEEIKSGDLFKVNEGEYLLNIRPDCDCIPRNGDSINSTDLYCLECKELTNETRPKITDKYSKKFKNFTETIAESIQFPIDSGKTIRVDFKSLQIKKFSEIKSNRIGRLIHPYITRIQQRYALYLQRQGLPPIPKEAVIGD